MTLRYGTAAATCSAPGRARIEKDASNNVRVECFRQVAVVICYWSAWFVPIQRYAVQLRGGYVPACWFTPRPWARTRTLFLPMPYRPTPSRYQEATETHFSADYILTGTSGEVPQVGACWIRNRGFSSQLIITRLASSALPSNR